MLSGHISTGDQTPGGKGNAHNPVQAGWELGNPERQVPPGVSEAGGWITGGKTSQKAGPQLSFSAGPCLVTVWAQPPFPGLQRGGDQVGEGGG